VKLSAGRILVTGAAGFIGSHLADRLASECELVLIDDFSVGRRENLAGCENRENVRVVEADVRDAARMRELMKGCRTVLHLATSCLRTSLQDPLLNHEVNAGGALHLCMAANDLGVERFVYVSSSEVYGSAVRAPMDEDHPCNPTTVYGASKLTGELYALAHHRTYGLPVTVVRPFNTYGPREPWEGARAEVIPRFTLRLLAGRRPVVFGDGEQTRDFTFVEDTVEGLVRAAASDDLVGSHVNIACGREVSILRIAELLEGIIGATSGVERRVPEAGRVERRAARPGDVARHIADISRARRVLGFEPTVPIEAGLERTVAWFRELARARPDAVEAAGAPNW
jgi:UDP-glucose 4-epimerase